VTVIKGKPVVRPSPEPPNEEWQTAAAQIMAYCAAMLWEPEGEGARRWLNDRGLADETLKRHFIGFNKAGRKLYGLWVPQGITIPHWQESLNRIWGIKIRRFPDGPDKYRAVKGSVPCLYLADDLRGRQVAVICEGEFDALLLAQEVGDPSTGSGQVLVGVVALGSAANKVRAINAGLPFLLEVNRLLVATDNDEEGERAAAYLLERTKRARRLRVPQGNDVTDFWKGGGDLREWVKLALG
jgi:DNA primase